MTWRVVIADDDADVRLLLRMILGRHPDFDVVAEAENPDLALEYVNDHRPDAAVIDHEFRGFITGLELAPSLKAVSPATKVIVFSAHDWLRSQVRESPATDAFILKTDVNELPEIVKRLLRD